MPNVAIGQTAVDAWKIACQIVLDSPNYRFRNLITEIQSPVVVDRSWFVTYDPKSVGANDRLSVVSKVLFPPTSRGPSESRLEFYQNWERLLKRARKAHRLHSSWGSTYFERLLSLDGSDNQIERMINVLTNWKQRKEAAIVAHLSAPRLDAIKPIGSPCLQFLEILWGSNNTIDLVALYRNHDYLNKALGNFIGLGRF